MLALIAAHAGEAGRLYAQQKNYTPEQRKWFSDQKLPGRNVSCCSLADGEEVQEEIRGVYYWIKGGPFGEWTQVPSEAVITDTPNIIGQPVIWWALAGEVYAIRCFHPGPKM